MQSRISGFARTTIFCRDIERSLKLYRDLLGLQVIEDKTLSGPAIGRLIGLETCRLRIVHLRPAGSTGTLIGLYGVLEPVLPATPLRNQGGLMRGATALVLQSDAVEEIGKELAADGYTFLTKPTGYETKTGGPSGASGTFTEMIFYDPDGVLVSIMGFRPAA